MIPVVAYLAWKIVRLNYFDSISSDERKASSEPEVSALLTVSIGTRPAQSIGPVAKSCRTKRPDASPHPINPAAVRKFLPGCLP